MKTNAKPVKFAWADQDPLLTVQQFAQHLGVDEDQVRAYISDPEEQFPLIVLAPRTSRVRLSEGNAWVDRRAERFARTITDPVLRLKAQRGLEARAALKAGEEPAPTRRRRA